jgi:transposase
MYKLQDGTMVQRDLYSSFLLYCIDLNTNKIDKNKCIHEFEKQFDQEFKQNAVNYCLTHPELSRKECAKNLGIGESTLYRWKQEAKANNNQATFKGSGNLTETELENTRLKRELKDMQDALEILKKAISILGE